VSVERLKEEGLFQARVGFPPRQKRIEHGVSGLPIETIRCSLNERQFPGGDGFEVNAACRALRACLEVGGR
jgi:hypothetical protein